MCTVLKRGWACAAIGGEGASEWGARVQAGVMSGAALASWQAGRWVLGGCWFRPVAPLLLGYDPQRGTSALGYASKAGARRATEAWGSVIDLLSPCIRAGVYNRDPDRCLDALTTMGVYVNTGDRTAVRRTAEFFLKGFQVCRLDGSTLADNTYGGCVLLGACL